MGADGAAIPKDSSLCEGEGRERRDRAELERSRETGHREKMESERGLEPDLESAGRLHTHGDFLGQEGLSSPGDSDVLGRSHVADTAGQVPKGALRLDNATSLLLDVLGGFSQPLRSRGPALALSMLLSGVRKHPAWDPTPLL